MLMVKERPNYADISVKCPADEAPADVFLVGTGQVWLGGRMNEWKISQAID